MIEKLLLAHQSHEIRSRKVASVRGKYISTLYQLNDKKNDMHFVCQYSVKDNPD